MVDDMMLLLKDCMYFTGKVRPDKNLLAGEQDVIRDMMWGDCCVSLPTKVWTTVYSLQIGTGNQKQTPQNTIPSKSILWNQRAYWDYIEEHDWPTVARWLKSPLQHGGWLMKAATNSCYMTNGQLDRWGRSLFITPAVNWHKARHMREERSQEVKASIRLAVSIFLIVDWYGRLWATVDSTIPRQVGLACVGEVSEKPRGSKLVSSISPYSLL